MLSRYINLPPRAHVQGPSEENMKATGLTRVAADFDKSDTMGETREYGAWAGEGGSGSGLVGAISCLASARAGRERSYDPYQGHQGLVDKMNQRWHSELHFPLATDFPSTRLSICSNN